MTITSKFDSPKAQIIQYAVAAAIVGVTVFIGFPAIAHDAGTQMVADLQKEYGVHLTIDQAGQLNAGQTVNVLVDGHKSQVMYGRSSGGARKLYTVSPLGK